VSPTFLHRTSAFVVGIEGKTASLLLERLHVNVVFVRTKGIVVGLVAIGLDGVVDDNEFIFLDVNEIK
jgi:hypothetical protein